MRKKHSYRSVDVKNVEAAKLLAQLRALLVVISLDVAKRRQVAAFLDPAGVPALLCHFEQPTQTRTFLDLVQGLVQAGKDVQVVLEPTGTYGDVLAAACEQVCGKVFVVNPKKTHDAMELFDGVPSQHDGKDATIVGQLHLQGLSKRRVERSQTARALRAMVDRREIHADAVERLQGQMEGLRARHFPELEQFLHPRKQRSAVMLLTKYPGPQTMVQDPTGVRELLMKASRGKLSAERQQGLLEAAEHSLGVPMLEQEQELVRQLATELERHQVKLTQFKSLLEEEMAKEPSTRGLVPMLGATTTAVLFAYMGDLASYGSAGALEKACGLNLKVSSSGRDRQKKRPPGLHLTKRGPGIVRKYLYLAAMRWVKHDPVAAAWYERRDGYSEVSKQRALIALMRKLVKLIWHVSRGAEYHPEKLFDLERLMPSLSQCRPVKRGGTNQEQDEADDE